jgi:hypothetical protein
MPQNDEDDEGNSHTNLNEAIPEDPVENADEDQELAELDNQNGFQADADAEHSGTN